MLPCEKLDTTRLTADLLSFHHELHRPLFVSYRYNFCNCRLNLNDFSELCSWALVSDRIGRKAFYIGSTLTQTICVALLALFIRTGNFSGFCFSLFTVGSLYGGSKCQQDYISLYISF